MRFYGAEDRYYDVSKTNMGNIYNNKAGSFEVVLSDKSLNEKKLQKENGMLTNTGADGTAGGTYTYIMDGTCNATGGTFSLDSAGFLMYGKGSNRGINLCGAIISGR